MIEQTEAEIKKMSCDWISAHSHALVWYNVSPTYNKNIKSKYVIKGMPDVGGLWRKLPFVIEFKKQKGIISLEQKIFLEEFSKKGGIAFVARSFEDVKRELSKY